ncbi:hypothetical protein [Alistipes onderdonkii]|uniref:hypothetical protein n=1 Tax=Alistipes onderdonkii TaxID=328813 RepID=UPI001875642B|nr:hypothetical protein [Alistipes onderdonkii]MBE5048009.1 hypothetical protein [Alistipes onderdonkii]
MKSEKAKQYLLKVVTPIAMMYPACRAGDRGADAEESGEGILPRLLLYGSR